ncbi:Trypsin [Metarhizium brunneum]|uniref:Trypsin n=1 Tax=Metarhizium brunneum TaxID=500148 RepID=A0A7D5URI3_9HYPO
MVRKAAITLAVALSAVLAVAATIDKRIKFGEAAKQGEFPSIIRIHYNTTSVLCGGSLLDNTTVLTAAHCWFEGLRTHHSEIVSVRAGSLNKNTGGEVAKVKSIKVHPEYKPHWNRNDIAILKLSTPIQESGTIKYANLPATVLDPVAASVVVAAGWMTRAASTVVAAGWGMTENNILPDKLLKVVLFILDPTACLEDGEDDPEYTNYLDTKVCAGYAGKDTSVGDSGGPLFDYNTTELIGVTSFGGLSPLGGFYTKISRYMTWINENLGDVKSLPSGVAG